MAKKIFIDAFFDIWANLYLFFANIFYASAIYFLILRSKFYLHLERLAFILFDFGFAIIFGILGLVTLLLHTPQEEELKNYLRARKNLSIGLIGMSLYCILRLIYPQHHGDYQDFWILTTVTIAFSWITYLSLLFLMESPKYLTRRFYIDGIVPIGLIIISGIVGLIFPSMQNAMRILFGSIFGVKCIYMFYTCRTEYVKCQKELDNWYSNGPDIIWIKKLIWICLFMSVTTVISFYVTEIHLFYYLMIPMIYTYMVFKIVNFAPKKIDNIRKKNESLTQRTATPEVKNKNKDLSEKIEPLVRKWVENKGYCRTDITIKDVAAEMGTNHSYLSQYINNNLEMTFQLWLNTLRIEESKKLLLAYKNMPIEEIGAAVGIPQGYNFSKWFRNITSTTPFRYRKENSK